MKVEVYENGNKESSRIYFGDVPRIYKEGKNWKLVDSTEIETNNSPRKMGEDFRDWLKEFTEIKPIYYDFNSGVLSSGIEVDVSSEELIMVKTIFQGFSAFVLQ